MWAEDCLGRERGLWRLEKGANWKWSACTPGSKEGVKGIGGEVARELEGRRQTPSPICGLLYIWKSHYHPLLPTLLLKSTTLSITLMPPKVPLILPMLPHFSAFGAAFLALFHCCRNSLFLPQMCWQQENSLRLKTLELPELWPDAWEFTFQAASHQPHRSWAVPALTPLWAANSTSFFGLVDLSTGVKTCPFPTATHFCLLCPFQTSIFFLVPALLHVSVPFTLYAFPSFWQYSVSVLSPVLSLSLCQSLGLSSKLVNSD